MRCPRCKKEMTPPGNIYLPHICKDCAEEALRQETADKERLIKQRVIKNG